MAEINQIVDPKAVEDILKASKALDGLDQAMLKFLQDQQKFSKQMDDASKSTNTASEKSSAYQAMINKAAQEQNKLTATAKALQTQQKQLVDTEAKLATAHTSTNQKLIEQRLKLQDVNKAMKDKVKANQIEEGSLNKMRQRLNELTSAYDNSGKRTKEAAKEIASLSKEIELAENETNRFQRGVGGYANQLKGMGAGLMNGSVSLKQFGAAAAGAGKAMLTMLMNPVGMVIAAVAALGIIIGKAVKQAREYQAAQAELAGVLGITRAETMALQKESQRLGATTAFTANEVTGLQIEYARLGFAQSEIMAVTESTINLSIAAKSGAADTAAYVGSVIRAYGMTADEAQRVADVSAKAYSSSALDFGKLQTAMAIVAPAAKAAGESFEATTAKIGKLADAGMDASSAGTALRNIYLDLAKKGMTYEQAMAKVASSQDKLTTANDLFGKRGAVAAIVLSDNAEAAKELTKTLEESGGMAKKVADEQLNTLEGSLKIMESTWSGLLFSIEDGNGIFITAAKFLIDYWTKLLQVFTGIIKGISTVFSFVVYVIKDIRDALQPTIDTVVNFGVKVKEYITDRIQPLVELAIKLKDTFKNLFSSKENEAGASAIGKAFGKIGNVFRAGKEYVAKFIDKDKEMEAAQLAAKEVKKTQQQVMEEQIAIQEEQVKSAKEIEKENKRMAKEREAEMKATLKMTEDAAKLKKEINKQELKDAEELDEFLNDFKVEETEADKAQKEELAALNQAMINQRISDENNAYQRKLMLLKANSANEEEYAQKKFELDKQVVQNSIDSINYLLKNSDITTSQRMELQTKLSNAQMDLDNMVFANQIENQDKLAEKEEEAAERRKEAMQAIADQSIEIANLLFDFQSQNYQNQLDELDKKNENGLLSDKEYAREKAILENKMAKSQRNAALFNIAINTAQAVSKIWAEVPKGDFGITTLIMTGLAIAAGAIQAATVISKPLPEIPAFAKGTDNAPSLGLFGEAGRELMQLNTGQVVMADKPTVFAGNQFKGAKIFSNPETEWIMNRTGNPNFNGQSRTDERMINEMRSVKQAIKDKPVFIFNKELRHVGTVTGNSTKRYVNRYNY
jgi:hypothetical protein